MLRPLLASIVLAASIQYATACSCLFSPLQERVCWNETNTILLKGVVKSVSIVGDQFTGSYLYVMKKVRVYQGLEGPRPAASCLPAPAVAPPEVKCGYCPARGSCYMTVSGVCSKDVSGVTPNAFLPGYPPKRKVELMSPLNGGLCGYHLSVGSKYLIDASYSLDDGRFHTRACGQTQGWPTTKKERRMLKKLLKRPDCTCSVLDCSAWNPPKYCFIAPPSDDHCIMPTSSDPDCSTRYRRCKRRGGVCKWSGLPDHCEATIAQPIEAVMEQPIRKTG